MCLAIPGRVLSIDGDDPAFGTAHVDFSGVEKTVNLAYTPDIVAGEFVLAHVGFAVRRVDQEEAVRMHEMGIACSILEAVQRERERYPGKRVSKVGVRIGQFAGEQPGTLLHYEGDALKGLPGKPSVHKLGFADLIIALKLLEESPQEVVVIGVQPLSTEWSAELTAPVRDALPALLDAVIEQLDVWNNNRSLTLAARKDAFVTEPRP
jgi:hydrogenase assembly chaperone HypC/HupF